MDRQDWQNLGYPYNGISYRYKKEQNTDMYYNIDEIEDIIIVK